MNNIGICSSCVGDFTFLAGVFFFFHILAVYFPWLLFVGLHSASLRGCIRHVFLVLNVLLLLWLERLWVSACVPMTEHVLLPTTPVWNWWPFLDAGQQETCFHCQSCIPAWWPVAATDPADGGTRHPPGAVFVSSSIHFWGRVSSFAYGYRPAL